jgi:hypothetical protein
MERRLRDISVKTESHREDAFDLDSLLHPAQAFEHPSHVVNDPDLTLNEKRAILSSWATGACAIEAVRSLRRLPGGKRTVGFDDVMEALQELDKQAPHQSNDSGRYRRILGRRERFAPVRNNSDRGEGQSVH